MLKKRNEEQILLSKLEMSQFITSVTKDISSLKLEIKNLVSQNNASDSLDFDKASILIKSSEIERLHALLVDAVAYKKYFYEDIQEIDKELISNVVDDYSDGELSEDISDDEL